jgi:hypothetical protein
VIGSSPSSHPNTRKPRVSGTPVIAVIGKPQNLNQWYGFPIAAITCDDGDSPLFLPCSSPVPPCYELTSSGKKVHERPVESRFCMFGVSKRSFSPLFFSLLAGVNLNTVVWGAAYVL